MGSKNLDMINTILGGYCTILLPLSAAFLLTTSAFFLLTCMCGPLPISLPITMNSCLRTSCSLLLRMIFFFSTWLHHCLGCLGSALVIISAALPLNLNLRPCLPLLLLRHCSLSCWIPAYLHYLFLF